MTDEVTVDADTVTLRSGAQRRDAFALVYAACAAARGGLSCLSGLNDLAERLGAALPDVPTSFSPSKETSSTNPSRMACLWCWNRT